MSGACVIFTFNSIAGNDITYVAPYELPEGEPCPPGAYVLLDPAQAQQLLSTPSSPFNLTNEQGLVVSSAIAGVWFVAWAFRRFNEMLQGPEDGA